VSRIINGGHWKRGYLLGGNVCAKEIGKRQKNYEGKNFMKMPTATLLFWKITMPR